MTGSLLLTMTGSLLLVLAMLDVTGPGHAQVDRHRLRLTVTGSSVQYPRLVGAVSMSE